MFAMAFVPKKDGGLRPMLDLCQLNMFIDTKHFRMTTLEAVIPLLQKYFWFTIIDLKDAYFHITIRDCYCKYLRFLLTDTAYQFVASF